MVIMKLQQDQVKRSDRLEICGYQWCSIKWEGAIEYPVGVSMILFNF